MFIYFTEIIVCYCIYNSILNALRLIASSIIIIIIVILFINFNQIMSNSKGLVRIV